MSTSLISIYKGDGKMSELRCLICGMVVIPNSYHVNSYSFTVKNEQGKIIYCPFCGVDKIYLDSEKQIYELDNKSLDKESLVILDHAMKLEVFNGEFYEEASILAKDEDVKQTFKDLMNIEFMHARIHKRLGGFKKLPKLHKPDYARYNTDDLLLEQAHKREEHAILFYKTKGVRVNSNTVKEVFKALCDVEKQHMVITSNSNLCY